MITLLHEFLRMKANKKIMQKAIVLAMAFAVSVPVFAQDDNIKVLNANSQQSFAASIPAGEYSGITHIVADTFAVVSDKAPGNGFFLWKIQTDSVSGIIRSVENLGYRGSGSGQTDTEGIAYNPHTKTIFLSNESRNSIMELTLDGNPTGRTVAIPDSVSRKISGNMGLESLCYDSDSHRLWTATEGAIASSNSFVERDNAAVRIFSFNDSLQLAAWYNYALDAPSTTKPSRIFTLGVSDLAAIGNGKLLVLEREARVAENYVGSSTITKIYVVDTSAAAIGATLSKRLLLSFDTKLTLLRQDWANFEGICVVPSDSDTKTLVLVSDSQSQYRGVLKDWLKTILVE